MNNVIPHNINVASVIHCVLLPRDMRYLGTPGYNMLFSGMISLNTAEHKFYLKSGVIKFQFIIIS